METMPWVLLAAWSTAWVGEALKYDFAQWKHTHAHNKHTQTWDNENASNLPKSEG